MGLSIVTPAAEEPVTLAEMKHHLRIDESDHEQDSLIESLIAAARDYVERTTRRALLTQSWKLTLDEFPANGVIRIPKPPLIAVASVKYIDLTGTEQTLATSQYVVDVGSLPGKIDRAYGVVWPSTRSEPNAVRIEFSCGFGGQAPEQIKAAIKLLVGNWFEHRESVITGTIATELPMSAQALIWPYRVLEAA